jgi:TolA-binding protein
MQRRPNPRLQHSQPDNKKRVLLVVLLLLLISGGVAWSMWSREDPQVLKVREMADQMEGLPWDQRRDQFRQMREEVEKLSEEQRDQFRNEMRRRGEAREDQRMKDFFAMSSEEQTAELDRMIDRMQEWRARREKEGGQRREGDRGRGRGDRGRGRSRAMSYGVDADGSSASVGRNASRLDHRSADSRARRDTFGRMMVDRMNARGIRGGFGRH